MIGHLGHCHGGYGCRTRTQVHMVMCEADAFGGLGIGKLGNHRSSRAVGTVLRISSEWVNDPLETYRESQIHTGRLHYTIHDYRHCYVWMNLPRVCQVGDAASHWWLVDGWGHDPRQDASD